MNNEVKSGIIVGATVCGVFGLSYIMYKGLQNIFSTDTEEEQLQANSNNLSGSEERK